MSKITIDCDTSELSKLFSQLSGPEGLKIIADSVEAGGRVVEQYAKINAYNVFSDDAKGNLAGSIGVDIEKTSHGANAEIGPSVIYGRIHELGGIILPVFAKMLHWVNKAGEDVFAKVVHMPARPYLRPAIDEHINEVINAMYIAYYNGIERFKKP